MTVLEYRGIKLASSVRLYKKDGDYNKQIKSCLDSLVDLMKDNGHTLQSEYVNDGKKILIDFHCGHESYSIEPSNYKQGKGCKKCAIEKNSKSKFEKAKKDLLDLVNSNGHKLLSEYKGDKEKILIDFNCGHSSHWLEVSSYKRGLGNCKKCGVIKTRQSEWHKRRHEEAEESLLELVERNGHELLSEYKRNTEKILIDFNCGHKPYWTSANKYKSDRGCPLCKESKGEKAIREWLEEQEIPYEKEYIFPNLPDKKYDFFLPSVNSVIEVHGIQHYEESYFSSKGRTLSEEQENDRIKRESIEALGYRYIEVDYRESNPKLALGRFIEQYLKLDKEVIM